ncbi:hypothetical protein [Chryseobacterium sp. JAH]|uniref:hypothetical protein n=1 Tax=Chryseobacterium sp. JAH TaxID=1742858 RepID=UPI000646BBB1|nr:hypothetical protein [Chryseobacterium sp. JAH]KUJ52882.1 hypothetical protein AR685_00405 [Chryseobacterium sp. JAH]
MFKTRFFALLFILLSFISFAQTKVNTDDQAIRKSLVYFVNSIKYKKIDQAVECIYPKYFTIISKEQMTQLLNMTYNNPLLKVDVQDMKFGNIEKPELIDGEYYSIVNYFPKLKCNVSAMNENMKTKIGEAMISKYGKQNVKYLQNEGSYIINANMRACAISKDKKSWKFLILEKQYKPQLVKILPKKILNKI